LFRGWELVGTTTKVVFTYDPAGLACASSSEHHRRTHRIEAMSDVFGKRVPFTLYNSTFDNRILDSNRFNEVEWGDLVELMLTERQLVAGKADSKLIAPVRFLERDDPGCQHAVYTKHEAKRGLGKAGALKLDKDGRPYVWRGAVNVAEWSMLPVDIDGEQTIAQAREFFKAYTYVAYTSFSHLKDGTTEKFRLLLPLEHPVPHQEVEARLPALKTWLGDVDLSSLAGARGFYLPSCPPEREHLARCWYNEGEGFLDLLAFNKEPANRFERSPQGRQLDFNAVRTHLLRADHRQSLLDRLRALYLGKYEDWWKVSSAMVNAGYDLADFKYVTIGGMMRSKTERDCEVQWQKALARHKRGGSISPGFLYNLVGWSSELRSTRREELKKHIEALERQLEHPV
jgi:hypothetical protein